MIRTFSDNSTELELISVTGLEFAKLGLSLNKNRDPKDMLQVMYNLSPKDSGHNKFLESINIQFTLDASMSFWTEFDTYRIGMSKQSESRSHTILKRTLTQDDFTVHIPDDYLFYINCLIEGKESKEHIMSLLPMGFKQKRAISTNLKTLRNIYIQRNNHHLSTWREFCKYIIEDIQEYISEECNIKSLMGIEDTK